MICKPNESLLFLSLHRACVGSAEVSCEDEQLTWSVSFYGFQDVHFVHPQHLISKPQYNLSPFANAQALQEAVGWFWGPVFVRCKKDILIFTSQLTLVS